MTATIARYMIEDLEDDAADEFVTEQEVRIEEGWEFQVELDARDRDAAGRGETPEQDESAITCGECGAEDIAYLPHKAGCVR